MKNPRYQKVQLAQRSIEWKAFRSGKFGGSDIASILDFSPYESRLQCWERMIFDTEVVETESMRIGTEREGQIRDEINKDRVHKYEPAVLHSTEYPFLMCSLDGLDDSDSSYLQIMEIKCCNREYHEMNRNENYPSHFYAQMQYQMYFVGCDQCMLVSHNSFANETIARLVKRDEKYIENMISLILAFRQRILDFRPPEPSDRDRIVINDPRLSKKAERYIELDRLISELQMEHNELRKELIAESDHPRVSIGNLNLSKVVRAGSIDYSTIEALKSIDLNLYRKAPIETWRLSYG